MTGEKLQSLTVFLLKPDTGLPRTALRDPNSLQRFPLRRALPFRGTFWLRESGEKMPDWVPFVRQGLQGELDVRSSTVSAVLLIEAAGRMFAITFGYGRALLEPGSFERDFGLRVALNALKPESIRSVDARTFETPITLQTRRQTNRGSALDVFGLNVTEDLVRAVSGEPREPGFARRLAGSDALVLSARLEFEQLHDKCAELLEMHGRDTYREHFAFIDQIRRITDPDRIERLDASLARQLQNQDVDRVHLAPPEIEDPERVEGFSYAHNPDTMVPDLDVQQYLLSLGDDLRDVTPAALKRQYVIVHYADAGSVARWRVYDCLTAEIPEPQHLFALSAGDWYEIEPSFAQEVGRKVARLADRPIQLPPARAREDEGAYNARVSRRLGHALLDAKPVRCADTRTPVEVCDLLTAQREFIHVKRKTRSSTLSHLFAQGVVSAQAFLWDGGFRQAARDELEGLTPRLVDLIPTGRPRADEYVVAYAVIGGRATGWPTNLPFFSQVNLQNAAERLERLGFRVSVTAVPIG